MACYHAQNNGSDWQGCPRPRWERFCHGWWYRGVIARRKPLTRSPIKRRAPKRKKELVNVAYRERVGAYGGVISIFGTTIHARDHINHGCFPPTTIHHIRNNGSPRDDRRILGLCVAGHLHEGGLHSIEHGKGQFEA